MNTKGFFGMGVGMILGVFILNVGAIVGIIYFTLWALKHFGVI